MNQNLAPTFEDLNSPAIDVAQSIGEIAVVTYNETTDTEAVITFDSFL
jgi:hypothetical protein